MNVPAPVSVLVDLNAREHGLVDAARHGVELVASTLTLEQLAASDDTSSQVRAELIRELLLGKHGELDPRGIRLRGARIVGGLDLDHLRTATGLTLTACVVSEPVIARQATLPFIVLRGSSLACLDGDELRVEGGLILEDVRVHGDGEQGMIRLIDARIGGELDLEDAEITNGSGPAVRADGIRVGSSLFLTGATLDGSGDGGAIRLVSASVGGHVGAEKVQITNNSGPAVDADGLQVASDLLLLRAHIHGTGGHSAIRLSGTRVGGQLSFTGTTITNDSGPALTAEGLQADDVFFRHAHVHGSFAESAIRLGDTRVTGQVDWADAEITNDAGPALTMDSIRIEGDLSLCDVRVRGSGSDCAIRLIGGNVAGQLDFGDAEIRNDSGPALQATDLHVGSDLFLRRSHVIGAGDDCTIRLVGARIGGQFECTNLVVDNMSGPVLDLAKAQVDGSVMLSADALCAEQRNDIGPCPGPAVVGLDGFSFTDLGRMSWRQWLHLIHSHTRAYRPQPYQQLAAVERAAGNDGNARHILITQQDDLRRRTPDAVGGWSTRLVHWIWGAVAGYGYRARRITVALFLAITAAGALGYTAGQVDTRPGHHAAERTIASGSPTGTACSSVELIGMGLDRGLPLGPTGLRNRCDLDTGTRRGQTLTVAIWVIQAVIWGLATLALTGYANLIRKTP